MSRKANWELGVSTMPIRCSCLGAIWRSPEYVTKDFVCERDCYFFPYFFSVKKKRDKTFM